MKTNDAESRVESGSIEEKELCICCLQPNKPGTTFCQNCGTPLTSYAATGPFESMLAEGDLWRKAIQGRSGKPWVRYVAVGFLALMFLAILSGLVVPR